MKYCRLLVFLTFISLFLAPAVSQTSDDFRMSINSSEPEKGDTIKLSVEVSDEINSSNLRYVFDFGDAEYERSKPVFERKLQTIGLVGYGVDVYRSDGERVFRERDAFRVKRDGDVTLQLSPEKVQPGDNLQGVAKVDGEINNDFNYEWWEDDLAAENINEMEGPRIEFETFPRASSEPELQVRVTDDEGNRVGTVRKQVEWSIPNLDIEGMNVDYSDESLRATISEKELERAKFRAGTSLKAWNEIGLDHRNPVGGVELQLEERDTEDFEDENDLIPYSVVEVSGENIEGIELDITSDIPLDWLIENDLLVSRQEAYVSFYKVEDGDWTRLSSEHTHSNLDRHFGLKKEHTRSDEWQIPSGGMTIAIAGNPDGIDFGKHALNPQGECEELSEDEPVPAGWEEVDVTCDTYEDTQRAEESLERSIERLENREEFEETISDIRDHIDDNRPYHARMDMEKLQREREAEDLREQLEETRRELQEMEEERSENVTDFRRQISEIESDINEYEEAEGNIEEDRERHEKIREKMESLHDNMREEMSETSGRRRAGEGSVRPEDQALPERQLRDELEDIRERDEELLRQLPPELDWLNSTYEEPEGLEARYEEVQQLIENEEYDAARDTLDSIREDKKEAGLAKIETATQTYRKIYNLKSSDRIEEEHIQRLDRAEQLLLEEQNVNKSAKIVNEVEQSVRIGYVRQMVEQLLQDQQVRNLIRDVVADVIPGL